MTAAAAPTRTSDLLHRRVRTPDWMLLVLATAVALAVRLPPILASGFPTGDGGLFLQMLEDLRHSFPALPATMSYNGAGIPFVYPPLAFYIAAAIGNAFGISSTDLLRFLPLAFSVLGVAAFYVLARMVLGSSAHAFVAGMAFAVLPRSYDWLVGGGGLTRAPGLLLAFLTLIAALRAFDNGRQRNWAIVGIGLGATALAHPQAAIFAAVGLVALLLFNRPASFLPGMATAIVCAIAVVTPWLIGLVVIHGPSGVSALASAGQRWDPWLGLAALADFGLAGGPLYAGPVMLGFAGLIACLILGRYLLPVWTALVFLAGAGGASFLAMPLVAMLIATFVLDVVLRIDSTPVSRPTRLRTSLVLAAVLAIALASGVSPSYSEAFRLRGLSTDQRNAMAWVSTNTPTKARFIVVEPAVWGIAGEWFPAIAHRISLNTLQGSEWEGRDAFERRGEISSAVAGCAAVGGDCLAQLAEDTGLTDALVFIPKATLDSGGDCCLALRLSLTDSPAYRLIYDDEGATIFEPREPN